MSMHLSVRHVHHVQESIQSETISLTIVFNARHPIIENLAPIFKLVWAPCKFKLPLPIE
jgi:hypothetical protein